MSLSGLTLPPGFWKCTWSSLPRRWSGWCGDQQSENVKLERSVSKTDPKIVDFSQLRRLHTCQSELTCPHCQYQKCPPRWCLKGAKEEGHFCNMLEAETIGFLEMVPTLGHAGWWSRRRGQILPASWAPPIFRPSYGSFLPSGPICPISVTFVRYQLWVISTNRTEGTAAIVRELHCMYDWAAPTGKGSRETFTLLCCTWWANKGIPQNQKRDKPWVGWGECPWQQSRSDTSDVRRNP